MSFVSSPVWGSFLPRFPYVSHMYMYMYIYIVLYIFVKEDRWEVDPLHLSMHLHATNLIQGNHPSSSVTFRLKKPSSSTRHWMTWKAGSELWDWFCWRRFFGNVTCLGKRPTLIRWLIGRWGYLGYWADQSSKLGGRIPSFRCWFGVSLVGLFDVYVVICRKLTRCGHNVRICFADLGHFLWRCSFTWIFSTFAVSAADSATDSYTAIVVSYPGL